MSQTPRQLVVLGGQGSGKGTQAKRLAERFDLELIGAGDVLRRIIAADTPLGRKIAPTVRAGKLLPDEVSSEIIAARIGDVPAASGFVLEGYPRSVKQSELFRANLERLGRPVGSTVFITLDVPRPVLKERLLKRHRQDDTEEIIEERFRLYDEKTKPIYDAVAAWAQVVHVDGNQPVPAVTATIINQLSDVKAQA